MTVKQAVSAQREQRAVKTTSGAVAWIVAVRQYPAGDEAVLVFCKQNLRLRFNPAFTTNIVSLTFAD